MAEIDYEIGRFFDRMASLSFNIEDYRKWMNDYENKRKDYPMWETRDGNCIKVEDISDSHLDNLILFILKRDPENKTNWIEAFRTEKRYREIKSKLCDAEIEYAKMREVSNLCL